MANGPTLPPQAYTREILAIAFQWLQNQPESIRKLAQSPDALVGLYLRAQRYGHTSPEADAPVTSQNFVNDLKNLAEGLKQFEDPKAEPAESNSIGAYAFERGAFTFDRAPEFQIPAPGFAQQAPRPVQQSAPAMNPTSNSSRPRPPVEPTPVAAPKHQSAASAQVMYGQTAAAASLALHLNANAQAMIHEVKTALNLSSDAEVLNMMVALAYKNVRNLLA